MDFYVYLHKKKTNGEVFYIGKGRGARAWHKHSRNKFWKSVVEKHGHIVELVFEGLTITVRSSEWGFIGNGQQLNIKEQY